LAFGLRLGKIAGDSAAITGILDRPVYHARARVIRVDIHGSAAYLYLTFFTTNKLFALSICTSHINVFRHKRLGG
jgi:hypothetical protein